MSNDLVDRLRLVRSPGIGPVTYRQLISRFGSPAAALEAVPDLAARGGGRPPRLISQSDAEREIASLALWVDAISSWGSACTHVPLPSSTMRRHC